MLPACRHVSRHIGASGYSSLWQQPKELWHRDLARAGARCGLSLNLEVHSLTWRAQVRTSNAFNLGMVAVLAACTAALGPLAMFKLYFVPYWVNVVWLDVVTYLHHHGPQDAGEKIPWYRGKVALPAHTCLGFRA